MLSMVMFLVFQGVFVGASAGGGTSFTDTRIHPHVAAQVTAYPFKNFGAFYRFSLSNPKFQIKPPFSLEKGEHMHVLGISVKFLNGNVQPFLEPGVAFYRERVNIKLFGEDELDEKQGRTAEAVGGGIYARVWKNLYVRPSGWLVGGRRPLWQADVGLYFEFGGSKGR